MSSRNTGRVQISSADSDTNTEKMSLTSSTLKRNPKMELSRSDLLRLLSILEGELQAREIVIAVLKAEQIKKLLYPNKCVNSKTTFTTKTVMRSATIIANNSGSDSLSNINYSDPWNALSRDAFGAYDPSFDETTTKALFNLKMHHLEALIMQQRKSRNSLKEQLRITESKYEKLSSELEQELRLKVDNNNAQNSCSDSTDSVDADSKHIKLENDIKSMAQTLEQERDREKQIVLCLLSERKQLIVKLIEERQKNEELLQLLGIEKGKIAEMVEGLEDESKRSLQMEAELEKYLSEFESERDKFRNQLAASESRNAELVAEVDRLREQIDKNEKAILLNIGEGVRSAIVTSSSTRVVPTIGSTATVSCPRASIAQPVSPKMLTASSNVSYGSITAINSKNAVSLSSNSPQAQHSYAAVQSISSVKMNATIPPPPSIPAPSPKSLTASPKVPINQICSQSSNATAFQNITYNLEAVIATKSATTTQSNHSTTNANQNLGVLTAANKVMVNMSSAQSSQQTQPQLQPLSQPQPQPTLVPIQRKLSASGAGRGTPPPIPPNKPVIKPVLPPQALQQRSKDINFASKAVTASSPSAKIAITNATSTTANNIKNSTTIAASDNTGEQKSVNCQPINITTNNSDGNSKMDNNVDLLCQELENFNSLLVSMVATGSKNN